MLPRHQALALCIGLLLAIQCAVTIATEGPQGRKASISVQGLFGERPSVIWVGGSEIWNLKNHNNGSLTLQHFNDRVFSMTVGQGAGASFLETQETVDLRELAHQRAHSALGSEAFMEAAASGPVGTITFDSKFAVSGSLEAAESATYTSGNVGQWVLWKHEDFQGAVTGFGNNSISNLGSSNDVFLGGPGKYAGGSVSKMYTLPAHKMVRIRARFHFFDEWTGEVGYVMNDNQYIWSRENHWCDKILTWFCKKYGLDIMGTEYPDTISVPVDAIFSHTSTTLNLAFGSTLTRPSSEVSWGLDDLMIYLK
eukprot:GILJ01000174.1.p1 GENE.GILJ01000174.1~~GILJ01000174.1.p1  ORF type:complete len:324 (+),score=36.89 GILJ01000174.1:45-974(+)